MKPTIFALAALIAIGTFSGAFAQNGGECTTRCETQFASCEATAEAALKECVDRADGNAHALALCAAAFTKLDDACRTTEAGCLSNCPTD